MSRAKVFDALLRHPAFLLVGDVYLAMEVRSTVGYGCFDDSTILWMEDDLLPFLKQLRSALAPLISKDFAPIAEAKDAIDTHSQRVQALKTQCMDADERLECIKVEMFKRRSVVLRLTQALEGVRSLTAKEKASVDGVREQIEAYNAEQRHIRRQVAVWRKEAEAVDASLQPLLRQLKRGGDTLDVHQHLIEKAQKSIETISVTDASTVQFVHTLWNRLFEQRFNVRKLLDQDVLEEQIRRCAPTADDRTTSSDTPPQKTSRRRRTEKPAGNAARAAKSVPDIDRFIQNMLKTRCTRDETASAIAFENRMLAIEQSIDSVERRRQELELHFVEDARRRTRDEDETTRALGKVHLHLYEKIMRALAAESRVFEARRHALIDTTLREDDWVCVKSRAKGVSCT